MFAQVLRVFTETVIIAFRSAAAKNGDFYGSCPLPKTESPLDLICQLLNHNYIFFEAISYGGLNNHFTLDQ